MSKMGALEKFLAKAKGMGKDVMMGKELEGPEELLHGPGEMGGSIGTKGMGRRGMPVGTALAGAGLGAAGGIGAYEGLKEDDSPVEQLLKKLGLS